MRLDHLLSKEKRAEAQNSKSQQGKEKKYCSILKVLEGKWGCSSAGRASALHAEGQEFDPPHLHQKIRAHSSGG